MGIRRKEMKQQINDEERRFLVLNILEMLSSGDDNKQTDEPTLLRCVYYYNRMLEKNKELKPIYGKFKRTHYGPYNYELYNDINRLIDQKDIVFDNHKLKLSQYHNVSSVQRHSNVRTFIEYFRSNPCDIKNLYPLGEMSGVEVGADLP